VSVFLINDWFNAMSYFQTETTSGKSMVCTCFTTFFECESSNKMAAIIGASFSAKGCNFMSGKEGL